MASRRKGRILAFQALYSWDLVYGQTGKALIPEGLLDFGWLENEKKDSLDEETLAFSRLLVSGTVENIAAIDSMIKKHLKNWDFSRVSKVDLALLRMSAYTLMYQTETAPSIVINEAIGISKEFGTDDSYRFINGVLDGIHKNPGASPNGQENPAV
ncbi:transcription antitermination factor NusB [Leadbettera azotonutricia]|uniref:Transcription antitermination protein NusB n=1 Tax=Leadbettera azotonutricia (strain ATCC BAA-888 / DSM 13862 / ZAS-9) TaxID=545695 RepID=F5Y7S1_LEAAZ|nr:transcription antitermination factor NusB [Leadbettera azotonutricia]AEF81353.1 transcription antitermination factor NusB [Leadbettera azotonutricia ZAS-9]